MTGPIPPGSDPTGHPDPGAAAQDGRHVPVLMRAVLGALQPAGGEVMVDATFGRGGYARAMLEAAPCSVVGIDRDPAAVAAGRAMAEDYPDRLRLVQGPFGAMDRLLERLGVGPVDGVAFDLGVSSPQIDDPARGFSFRFDGPLDMRMSGEGATAADAVNTLAEEDLAAMLRDLGEERYARRIARAIVRRRAGQPIERTGELAELVRRVVPRSRDGIDPATRTFQALRIHVNDELGEIDRGLAAAERVLKPGGRLAVVAFHSLEDRRVKRFLADRSGGPAGAGVSRHQPLPAAARRAPTFRLLRKKPVEPTAEECQVNPRARSARMRSAVRTDAPAWPEGTGVAA